MLCATILTLAMMTGLHTVKNNLKKKVDTIAQQCYSVCIVNAKRRASTMATRARIGIENADGSITTVHIITGTVTQQAWVST